MTLLHMGALHPVEQLLTLLLAFGPFLVLGGVIWWRRRHEDDTEGVEVVETTEAGAGQLDR